jgi:hypothetical protein
MITINCHGLTSDEQLALASAISDALSGNGVALARDKDIVIDTLKGPPPDPGNIESIIRKFVEKRPLAEHYSVEREGDFFLIHSPDPIAGAYGRRKSRLPDNVRQCPFCGFVTPYEELYTIHIRAHGFGI